MPVINLSFRFINPKLTLSVGSSTSVTLHSAIQTRRPLALSASGLPSSNESHPMDHDSNSFGHTKSKSVPGSFLSRLLNTERTKGSIPLLAHGLRLFGHGITSIVLHRRQRPSFRNSGNVRVDSPPRLRNCANEKNSRSANHRSWTLGAGLPTMRASEVSHVVVIGYGNHPFTNRFGRCHSNRRDAGDVRHRGGSFLRWRYRRGNCPTVPVPQARRCLPRDRILSATNL